MNYPYGQMKMTAQKVEFFEMKEAYEEVGFEYFQGFYFAHTHLIAHRRIDPQYLDVMNLFTLLQNDAFIDVICEEFKQQNILSLQLFQFLRSVHPETIEGINSLREMIERVGKNTHAVFATSRINTMLSLLRKILQHPTEKQSDDIHLIAMLSLLEGLMNIPMDALFHIIHPKQEIEDALLSHTGVLGRIYAATLKLESGDFNGAFILLRSYGITLEQLHQSV